MLRLPFLFNKDFQIIVPYSILHNDIHALVVKRMDFHPDFSVLLPI